MKIKTALILCAGFGKRLKPITLNKPKPLLELNNITLLENAINLIKELGIKKILINTFHLKDQINDYIIKKNFNISINVVPDGNEILNTGGEIGRKLEFFTQELGREVNTIGSKSFVEEISQSVIQMKVQLEKIREQALNLE